MNKIALSFYIFYKQAFAYQILGYNKMRILLDTMDAETLGHYDPFSLAELDTNFYGEGE